jgi:sugar phosphate isomerase/epimerase
MAQEGAKRAVQVCLENLSEGPDDLAPVIKGCPELGITADIGHGEILSDGNRALEIIQEWPDRIKHVHAHDNRGGNRVKDDLHLPIGEGRIDFSPIFRALIDGGYRGTVTIEVSSEHLPISIKRLQNIVAPLMEAIKR